VYLVNLVEMDFLGVPRPKRGGSGYPLYPASPISIGLPGCRFYPSRGASRSKQGTKIEEMGFWGKEIQNTSNCPWGILEICFFYSVS